MPKSILSIGEMLIDFIPDASLPPGAGGALSYRPHPGGAPANVSVAAARLGGASCFVGKLSEDSLGQLLMRTLVENDVETRFIPRTKAPTSLALVTLGADGERQFTFYRQGTADTLLEITDLDWNAWQNVALCHAGSVSLSCEPSRSATLAALDYTRQVGAIVSFDVNARPALWASPADLHNTLSQIIGRIDLLKFSAEEAGFISPGHPQGAPLPYDDRLGELGKALLEQGPSLVIITLGARGALLMTAKQYVEVSAPLVRVVDTTGAGDAFMGAILYQLVQHGCSTPADLCQLSENELRNMGNFASRVAGISCTRYGAIASLPFRDEI